MDSKKNTPLAVDSVEDEQLTFEALEELSSGKGDDEDE